MKKHLLYLLLLVVCFSYIQKPKRHQRNKNLIDFQSKFIYDADAVDMLDSNIYNAIISSIFNDKTDTITYRNGKIRISYLKAASGCAEYTGDITFDNDTIKLLLENKANTVCAERNVWRVIYTISNKDDKKYFMKKY